MEICEPETTCPAVVKKAAESKNSSLESKQLAELLSRGLNNGWEDQPIEKYIAFYWLLETYAERIPFGELAEFRRWDYWEMTGIPQHFSTKELPFKVPKSAIGKTRKTPQISHLDTNSAKELLKSTFAIPESEIQREVMLLRDELLAVIESVYDDGLTLLAVAIS